MTARVSVAPLAIQSAESVASQLARHLMEQALTSGLANGQRMPSERDLVESMGVGRSAVREALKLLELLGIVEVRLGDGTYVREPSGAILSEIIEWGLLVGGHSVLDLVEVRAPLEITAAGLAAERRTDQDVADLRKLLRAMLRAKSISTQVKYDVQFHIRLAEASKNVAVSNLLRSLQSLLAVWARKSHETHDPATGPMHDFHVGIFEAVERGDRDAAVAEMTAHMKDGTRRLQNFLEERAVTRHPVPPYVGTT